MWDLCPLVVYGVFQNVAKNYDTMNDAMSLGIHRWWKDSFMRLMNPTPGIRLLDVAGGTGGSRDEGKEDNRTSEDFSFSKC